MGASAAGRGWLRPWWWERQDDPNDAACTPSARPAATVVPAGALPDVAGLVAPPNTTHREVAVTGTLGGGPLALVDPRGAVQVQGRTWSLDWLIGADDGWHAPARTAAVRRRTIEGAPVIETEVRAPGGSFTHRVFAAVGPDGADVIVVEVRNDTPVAGAVAFAVRPFTTTGVGRVGSVELSDTTVLVDGEAAVALPRPPGRWAGGDAVQGDSALVVLAGDAAEPPATPMRCAAGLANATFVLPVPHTATARVVLAVTGAVAAPTALPPLDNVVSGWRGQLDRGARVVLPAGVLADRVREATAAVLLAAADEDLRTVPPRRLEAAEEAAVLGALDAFGFGDEAGRLLVDLEERVALDGYLGGPDGRGDANGALLAALAAHVQLTDDTVLADQLVGPVAKAAHWVGRTRRPRRAKRAPRLAGALPDGPGPRWCGGSGTWLRDLAWSLAGVEGAAEVLALVDQPDAAADLVAQAADLRADLDELITTATRHLGTDRPGVALAPQPDVGIDRRVVASLEPLMLLGDLPPALVDGTLDAVADAAAHAGLIREPATGGSSVALTSVAALAAAATRPGAATQRLRAAAFAGPGAGTWPEVVHPRTGGGVAGDPWHAPSAAWLLLALRRLLLVEPGGCWWERSTPRPAIAAADPTAAVLDLVPILSSSWVGAPFEVHALPAGVGSVSYAVRWHGPRPALLWEIDPRSGVEGEPPLLVSSGLDPTWSARAWRGEALLAPPVVVDHDHVHDDAHAHDHDHDGHDHDHGAHG